jgi:outer membrane immunogenic protein
MTRKWLAMIGLVCAATPQLAQAEGSFSGLYAGAGAGYGFNGQSVTTDTGGSLYDFDLKGSIVSLIGGYNFQSGNFVFGLEGDANFGKIKDAQTVIDGPFRYDGKAASENYYTLRARIGFTPSQSLLLYGTGGPAWGTLSTQTILTAPTVIGRLSPFTAVEASKSVSGFMLGLGGEYKIGDTAALRLEYSELYFNGVKFDQRDPGGPTTKFNTDNDASFIRSAVTFSF